MFFKSVSDAFSWSTQASRSAKIQEFMSDYRQGTRNKYPTCQRRHTFVLLVQRLVLANQVIALCMHFLHLVMVLGEGSIQLDCSIVECFLALLSSFSNDSARSTVSPYPWSILDFCRDLSTTSCTMQQLLLGYSILVKFDYSRAPSCTFIHNLVRRIVSKFGQPSPGR
jgi:hypothetical protein